MTESADVPRITKAPPAESSSESLNYADIMPASGGINLADDPLQRAANLPSILRRDSYPYPAVQISENVFVNNNFPLKFTESQLRQEIQRNANLKGEYRRPELPKAELPKVELPKVELPETKRAELQRPDLRRAEVQLPNDRVIGQPARQFETPSKTYEYQNLRNRSAPHTTPDALLYVPKNFDQNKPINLVVYNHGFGSTVKSSYRDSELGKQMADAPPNTVLIIPEWQAIPGSRGYNQGNLAKPGAYRAMVEEVFNKTPELRGKTMSDVSKIHIVSHSAGHAPTEAQIGNNGLSSKIASITMIDSSYSPQKMEGWLRSNIRELANGSKRFISISNDTNAQNAAQAAQVEQMMRREKLSTSSLLKDFRNSGLDERSLTQYPIIFKNSSVPHNSMVKTYFGTIERASKRW